MACTGDPDPDWPPQELWVEVPVMGWRGWADGPLHVSVSPYEPHGPEDRPRERYVPAHMALSAGELVQELRGRCRRNERLIEMMLGFIREDLSDLGDAIGHDHPLERFRLGLSEFIESRDVSEIGQ